LSLADLIADAEKNAKISVTKLSDPESLCHVSQWLSTGIMPLDIIMNGGFPVRRITEIYGDNSTGKTLLATQAIISTQEQGGFSVYADPESALDPDRLKDLGVDNDKLAYIAPNTVDEVFKALIELIDFKNKHIGKDGLMTFVWDSVASIATMDELDADSYEARNYPTAARSISGAMRKIIREVASNNVCLVLTNQTRQKLGVMFGDGATTYGGKAIGFYSTMRIELQNRAKLKESNKRIVGVQTQATVVKNRFGPPYRHTLLPVYYDYGIDEAECAFNMLKELDLLKGKGWYTLQLGKQEHKFQKKTFSKVFDDHYDKIAELLESAYG